MGNSSSGTVAPPDYICEYNVPNCPNHPPPDWDSTVYGPPTSSKKYTIGRAGGVFSQRKESGYQLLIPQDSVPEGVTITVEPRYPDPNSPAVPEGNTLVSGVHHIDSEEIELEKAGCFLFDHCLNIRSAEDRDSVAAVVARRERGIQSARDEFKDVDDSDVDVRNDCVRVTLRKLGSLMYALVLRKERRGAVAYCGMLYRLKLEASLGSSKKISFFFAVVRNFHVFVEAVEEKCAERNLEKTYYEPVFVTFAPPPKDQNMALTLDMKKEGIRNDAWHIYPYTWPAEILEEEAYKYHPNESRIPSFELRADWKERPQLEGFVEFIDIKGTITPKSLTLQFDVVTPFRQETTSTNEEQNDPTVPKMSELIKCDGQKKIHNIPEEIGTKYNQFGIFLLDDPTGSKIRAIEWEYRYNSEAINQEILRRWLEKEGRKPVQWDTLIQVLKDISRHTLAEDIEYGLKERDINF